MRKRQPLRQKQYSREALAEQVKAWKAAGETVVFTNGCFDILHAGHISYLSRAATLGDRLIIGLNADVSVSRLKGPERPIQNEGDRALIISALGSVDAVVIFEEDTPEKLIESLLPDILVKGADYSVRQIAGAQAVISYGGSVVLLPILSGRSTSKIVGKMGR
jgi:D-beta-D-heptose 7-phosphate kinase/D-beta-D-heptose 1-phosphate adenosyltransferase